MKYTDFAKKIAKEYGASYIESGPDWNGREVWEMLFYDPTSLLSEVPCTGYPMEIVFEPDGYFITDPDQAIDYMHYVEQNYGYDDEDKIIGFDAELVKVE